MPLVAFILLAVVCLLLIGFVCACLSDHPAQAVERALALGGALPPVVVVWALLTAFMLPRRRAAVGAVAMGRSSPLLTQRLRF
jgi:ABC-type Fe3+ transport system permease subunit